jgi:hypothetical protein
VKFSGTAAHPNPRLGVWLWADTNLAAAEAPLAGVSCSEPTLPHYRERTERRGIRLLAPSVARG